MRDEEAGQSRCFSVPLVEHGVRFFLLILSTSLGPCLLPSGTFSGVGGDTVSTTFRSFVTFTLWRVEPPVPLGFLSLASMYDVLSSTQNEYSTNRRCAQPQQAPKPPPPLRAFSRPSPKKVSHTPQSHSVKRLTYRTPAQRTKQQPQRQLYLLSPASPTFPPLLALPFFCCLGSTLSSQLH